MKSYQRTVFPQGQGPPPSCPLQLSSLCPLWGPPTPTAGLSSPERQVHSSSTPSQEVTGASLGLSLLKAAQQEGHPGSGQVLPCTPPAPFPLGFPSSLSSAGSTDLEVRDLGQRLALPITNRATLDKPFYLPTPQFLHI